VLESHDWDWQGADRHLQRALAGVREENGACLTVAPATQRAASALRFARNALGAMHPFR